MDKYIREGSMVMKYAIVTGSTKGIGKAIAIRLLREGYYVIVNYSNDDKAAELFEDEVREYKDMYLIIKEKLSNYKNAMSFVKKVKEKINYIDCMVFNCGMTDRSAFRDISKDSWEQVINTNLNVPFYILQQLDGSIQSGGYSIYWLYSGNLSSCKFFRIRGFKSCGTSNGERTCESICG